MKQRLLFWEHPRARRDEVLSAQDLARLHEICEVTFAEVRPGMTNDEVRARQEGHAVCWHCWNAPFYTSECIPDDGTEKLLAIFGGSLRPRVDRSVGDRRCRVTTSLEAQGRLLADLTFTLILAGLHQLPACAWSWLAGEDFSDLSKHYVRFPQRTLFGKRVGLVGFGAIARSLTALLAPYRCRVMAYDPYIPEETFAAMGVERRESLIGMCSESQVLSIHAPKNDRTEGMVGERELAALPDGAVLVNTALPQLLNQSAVEKFVSTGKIVALQDGSFQPSQVPQLRPPHALLTPCIAGHSDGLQMMGGQLVDEIACFVHGRPLQFEVDWSAVNHLA